MTQNAANPFAPRAVLALVVLGALAFLATLYFGGQSPGRARDDGTAAHAQSMGLNGFAGLVRLLRERGETVRIARTGQYADEDALLILTPPFDAEADAIDAIVAARRHTGPTVVVMPKWVVVPADQTRRAYARDGWVAIRYARPPDWAGAVAPIDGIAMYLAKAPRWTGLGRSAPTANLVVQGTDTGLVPLVRGGAGRTLAGYAQDGGYYPMLDAAAGLPPRDADTLDQGRWNVTAVLEPDLFNNYGMADRDRAALALALIDVAREGRDLPIVFDVSLAGLGGAESLLTLAFRPPYLAATLCLVLAAAIAGWRAFARFGPPLAPPAAAAPGKSQLVASGARLIERARRPHLLGPPYAALVARRLARRLGLRDTAGGADPAAIAAALATRAPGAPPFAQADTAMRNARSPAEATRAAMALARIERTLAR